MKIAVIGGGSTYTPELIAGFLERLDQLRVTKLYLMDTSKERLDIVGGFAQRMVRAHRTPFEVVLTQDQAHAIESADYVLTQIRVGMMNARKNDEYLGFRHGLIGQETTGVGGMAKALRTIPVILDVASDVHRLAPKAMLVNFTNPAGLVTEALKRYAPDVQSVGVCNVALNTKMEILGQLEKKQGIAIHPSRAALNTLGLNHLTWHRGFTLDGEELWPVIFQQYLDKTRMEEQPEWDLATLESLRMIPNYYLQYFYYPDQKLKAQQNWPPSRAEVVMKIEEDLLRQYSEPNRTVPPEDLMKRGGAYYSTVATQLINAHHNDLNEIHVVNTRQDGAVQGLPADWVLEMPCLVNQEGIHPLPAEPLPPVCTGLVAQVKSYELLTVEAAVHGDRNAAYQALLAHPLGPSADQVQTVLDDLLETNREYLPQFWN